jgi:thiosulfate reductase cytochrome b subunit
VSTLVRRHHAVVRVTHWVNLVAVIIMSGSGLRILQAYPAFHRPGETLFGFTPSVDFIPKWLSLGGWLGGARQWHFAMMWVLAVNGFVYVAFLFLHGEWRDLAPRRGDVRDMWTMVRYYVGRIATHPVQGKHNALQKWAYASMPVLGLVLILSGLAIWKPVTLGFITALFGNYVIARFVHFASMVVLLGLALGHVVMVFSTDPYAIRAMLSGWYDEQLSPEARNARPFRNLFPKRQVEPEVPVP